MLAVPALLTACSNDNESTPEQSEIRLKSDVWKMMEGTRATTIDDSYLQNNGFSCTAYTAGTTTANTDANIIGRTVSWSDTKWVFNDGSHYWPTSGNLDFFAYMPVTTPGYISSVNYAVDGTPAPAPYFVCANLPMTDVGQRGLREFIWALSPAQNKASQGATGVTMNFKHPFALIKFVIAAGSGEHVQVNRISIAGLNTGGTCTFKAAGTASTWSSQTGSATLTITPANPLKYNTAFTETTLLMVIPNTDTKTLTVNGTWDDWSDNITKDISTNISIDWHPGYKYTYNLTVTPYALKVDATKYTEQW